MKIRRHRAADEKPLGFNVIVEEARLQVLVE